MSNTLPLLPLVNAEAYPSVGGHGENLQLYLDPVNSQRMQERIGKETSVRYQHPIEVTRGQAFRTKISDVVGLTTGRRYLMHRDDGVIVAALNITTLGRSQAVVSNIYVHRDYRRQGLATQLIKAAKEDYPRLTVDCHQTTEGAAFFGYADSPACNQAPSP